MMTKSSCELLLPVGNMKMCLAAIHNGADAIYVGMPEFNARGRSVDHTVSDLKEMIELCHLYGVKVNLAFNVVIFEEEIPEVINLLKQVLPLCPDAIIVQDLGLCLIIKAINPDQIIHASTQMTITNHEAISLLRDLKIKRFVLGREVSINEMKAIREKWSARESSPLELEVFVHGALCVAYSGQCFTSESICGRSANRCQCAQSCRFEYEMIVDGKVKNLIDEKYLVSPHDLCGIAQIPLLCDLEINSFKVEGRLKTPEYVASTARSYRKAIDEYFNKKELSENELKKLKFEMGLTYSRGFFTGWLNGVDHQNLVDGTYSAHRGNFIGSVLKNTGKSIIIKTDYKLKPGDGILFANTSKAQKLEFGSKIFEVKPNGKNWELFFGKNADLKEVRDEYEVYFNSDQTLFNELTKSFEDKNLKKKIPLSIHIETLIGRPLKLTVIDDDEHAVQVFSNLNIEEAIDRPTQLDELKKEITALGNTVFKCRSFNRSGDENIFIHQKELKNIRRLFTEKMMDLRINRSIPPLNFEGHELKNKSSQSFENKNFLNILIREFKNLAPFLEIVEDIRDVLGLVILDYEFGKDYKESVDLLRSHNVKVAIATTRILKPNEYHNFKVIERANPDAILIRNLGALYYFNDISNKRFELRGDFSLNVTNSKTHEYLISKNLKTICASYDLNDQKLKALLQNSQNGTIEVTIHQYMPSFHMEHCVFAAFLSKGSSFRDCGKPCEKHHVELKDQFGNGHFIRADQECRNTMFNALPQSAAKKVLEWSRLGLSEFRFESLNEKSDELKIKILAYADLIRHLKKRDDSDQIDHQYFNEIYEKIGVVERYGLSEGSLSIGKEYKDRKKVKA
jgi:putative protease